MRIPDNTFSYTNFSSYNKSLDQKDKILLSTPALAAISAAYKNRRKMPSKIVSAGALSGLKWGAFLLSLCSMININKFLARNSQKIRNFENNHEITAMAAVGAASTGGYYLLQTAGKAFTEKHPKLCSKTAEIVNSVDNNDFIMGVKSFMRDSRLSYRRKIKTQPSYVLNSARFLERTVRAGMTTLPYVGAGLACALAVVKPRMMPEN